MRRAALCAWLQALTPTPEPRLVETHALGVLLGFLSREGYGDVVAAWLDAQQRGVFTAPAPSRDLP